MKHVHLIGIGGTGLSAIAQVLIDKGYSVSGSDRESSPLFAAISAAGAKTYLGHAPENVTGADLVIRSSAIPDDNPEVVAALAQGIPVVKRRDFLGELTKDKNTLAIAGTHGKTTTTAMLIWILHQLEMDPSFILGGLVSQLGCNAHAGKGPHFIIEADEYDYMFLGLEPEIAIITNVEHEHADCFPTHTDYLDAFKAFVECVRPNGKILFCLDDPGVRSLTTEQANIKAQTLGYGTLPDAHYTAQQITIIDGFPSFELSFQSNNEDRTHLGTVNLRVPGQHNVLNATGALGAIHQLDLPMAEAILAISQFTGAGRRFEVLGQADGVTVINDYGHHPTEIAATLEAAHARYPNQRIWAIWQPHTYSRTQNLADRFINALDQADRVIILKIYAAREQANGYSAEPIAKALPAEKAKYAPTFDLAAKELMINLVAGDIVIVFSAGDATHLSEMVLHGLQQRENKDKEPLP